MVSYEDVNQFGLYSAKTEIADIVKPSSPFEEDGFFFALDASNRDMLPFSLEIKIPLIGTSLNGRTIVHESSIKRYFDALAAEIQSFGTFLDRGRVVASVLFSGDGANVYDTAYLQNIIEVLQDELALTSDTDIAIHCNPSFLTLRQIDDFRRLGISKITINQVDLSAEVRAAAGLPVNATSLDEQIRYIQKRGRIIVEVGLSYGLPLQTAESVARLTEDIVALSPDLIAVKPLNRLLLSAATLGRYEEYGLPPEEECIAMFMEAYEVLTKHCYFPLSSETYSHTKHSEGSFAGTLAVLADVLGARYGVGAGAESLFANVYAANESDWSSYCNAVLSGGYSSKQGGLMDTATLLKVTVFNSLSRNGEVNVNELSLRLGVTVDDVLSMCGLGKEVIDRLTTKEVLSFNGSVLALSNPVYLSFLISLLNGSSR